MKFFLLKFFSLALLLCGQSLWAKPFEGTKFVISGPSPHSPAIARKIYRQGGNLADMAVAVSFALAVTHPYYVSLGSGGFALIKMDSSVKALDFRETAPAAVQADFFEKSGLSSREGGAAVAVPGFVAGMRELHKKYGKLKWSQLIQPAQILAERGFPVSGDWASITEKSKDKFDSLGRSIFFKEDGKENNRGYLPGEIFKQLRLAQALKKIKRHKDKAFYEGEVGKDIVSAVRKHKGLLSEEDLKQYKPRWFEPLSTSFRGYRVFSMPLPSSGGIILFRALKIIERQKLFKQELYSLNELHLLAEIMSRAFYPRALMGDPDFMEEGQKKVEGWLSEQSLEKMESSISLKRVRKMPPPTESGETTHISLMDSSGNALSITITLNGFYGSHLVSEKYGIVLNNQMDDFTTLQGRPNMFGLIQGKNNSPQGGKRPLSSMSPVIVEKNGETVLALGGAGGPKIINAVLQTLYRHLIHRMDVEQAVLSPRIHHQFLPDKLFIEDKRFNPELIIQLKLKGHEVQFKNYIAQIFAVSRTPLGTLSSARESRRESSAGGL